MFFVFGHGRRDGFRGYLTLAPWRLPVAASLRGHYRKSIIAPIGDSYGEASTGLDGVKARLGECIFRSGGKG